MFNYFCIGRIKQVTITDLYTECEDGYLEKLNSWCFMFVFHIFFGSRMHQFFVFLLGKSKEGSLEKDTWAGNFIRGPSHGWGDASTKQETGWYGSIPCFSYIWIKISAL